MESKVGMLHYRPFTKGWRGEVDTLPGASREPPFCSKSKEAGCARGATCQSVYRLLDSKRGLNETEEDSRGLAGGIGFEEGEISLKQGCYSALIKVEHVEIDA